MDHFVHERLCFPSSHPCLTSSLLPLRPLRSYKDSLGCQHMRIRSSTRAPRFQNPTGKGHCVCQLHPNEPEASYSTTERKYLAAVWAITKFRPSPCGRHFDFVTDLHSLCWLLPRKSMSGRLGRWILVLHKYDFFVRHKSARIHYDADVLSLCPLSAKDMSKTSTHAATTTVVIATLLINDFL